MVADEAQDELGISLFFTREEGIAQRMTGQRDTDQSEGGPLAESGQFQHQNT